MSNNKPLILLFFTSISLFGCTQNKNYDVDLSNLPVIKTKEVVDSIEEKEDPLNSKRDQFIEDLIPFKNKDKVLSEFKFGKIDPFSESAYPATKLLSDFKLTGFLNTGDKKYVFVSYLGIQGSISEESIGGFNTNLLPKGAKVIDINTKKMQLKINFDDEDYIFEF